MNLPPPIPLAAAWPHGRLVETLGWTLLHSLWQFAAVAALTALTLAWLRRATANLRYAVASAALLLMVGTMAATYAYLLPEPTATATTAAPPTLVNDLPALQNSPAPQQITTPANLSPLTPPITLPWRTRLQRTVQPWLPTAVACYFAGALLMALRLALGYGRLRSLTLRGTDITGPIRHTLDALLHRMTIQRTIRLLSCGTIEVPTLLGAFKPVILLPAAALAGLSPQQLEALLAHELAHIRRHDYVANLLQSLLETALFYHPAVWWLSARIRQERENCCDDAAIALTGDRLTYARALASMESLRGVAAPALAARGAGGGTLLPRIRRLLGLAPVTGPRRFLTTTLAGLLVTLLAAAIYIGCSQTTTVSLNPPARPTATMVSGTGPIQVNIQLYFVPFDTLNNAIAQATIKPTSQPTSAAASATFDPSDAATLQRFLQAIEADPQTTRLAAPRLRLNSGQAGKLESTSTQNFVKKFTPTTGTAIAGTGRIEDPTFNGQSEIGTFKTGVEVDVTATVQNDRRILTAIHPKVTTLDGMDIFEIPQTRPAKPLPKDGHPQGAFVQLPKITTTECQLTAPVPDGGTLVIFGPTRTMEQQVQKSVPVLSQLPGIGGLFTNRSYNPVKVALIVIVQPTSKIIPSATTSMDIRRLKVSALAADARTLYDAGQFREAADLLRQATSIDPRDQNVALFLRVVMTKLTPATTTASQPRQDFRQTIDNPENPIPNTDLMVNPDHLPEIPRQRASETAPATQESPQNRAALDRLEQNMDEISADAQGVEKVFNFIRDTSALPVDVKWDLLAKAGANRTTPVSVNLKNTPFRKVLTTVLVQLGDGKTPISFDVVNGHIVISTKEDLENQKLSQQPVTIKVFDVRDLLVDTSATPATAPAEIQKARQAKIDNLLKTIEDTVMPDSWKDHDGKIGSIRELNGQLIVNQTTDTQIAVYNLLQQLRAARGLPRVENDLFGLGYDRPTGLPGNTNQPATKVAPAQQDRGEPDGQVIRVNSATGEVFINLTAKDRVTPGMTFTAYDPRTGVRQGNDAAAMGHGSLEVVQVGETYSICRVTRTTQGQAIQAGDLIANAVYHADRSRKFRFVVVGNIDLDGDGKATAAERDRIVLLIKGWGGQVDDDLTAQTDYLVAGERPASPLPALDLTPATRAGFVIEGASQEQQRYDDLIVTAKRLAVPVLNANRFLGMMGLPTTAPVIRYPATAPASRAGQEVMRQSIDSTDQLVPYADLMVYPDNWPEIARYRASVEANQSTPQYRAAQASLDANAAEFTLEKSDLETALNKLRDNMKADIFVNWAALQSAGFDRRTPVSVNLKDVPYRKVLTTILTQGKANSGLAFTIVDGIITISTKEDLTSAKYQIVKVFDVRDLLTPPATQPKTRDQLVTDLIDHIKRTISPDTWRDSGGKIGSIRELNGQLIINQTIDAQTAIFNLLQQTREARGLPNPYSTAATRTATTSAPASKPSPAAATSAAKVRPGDRLHISIFELVTPGLYWDTEVVVDAQGNIELPIGKVHVAGSTSPEVEAAISKAGLDGFGGPLPKGAPGPDIKVELMPPTTHPATTQTAPPATTSAASTAPAAQVLIKLLLASTDAPPADLFGVTASGPAVASQPASRPTGPNLGAKIGLLDTQIQPYLLALAAKNKLNVLSRPYMLLNNHQSADFFIGQDIPASVTYVADAAGKWTPKVEYAHVGLTIKATPHINPDGLVTLDVELSDKTLLRTEESPAPNTPPELALKNQKSILNERTAKSRVAIRNGDTIIISWPAPDAPAEATKPPKQMLLLLTPHLALPGEDLNTAATQPVATRP